MNQNTMKHFGDLFRSSNNLYVKNKSEANQTGFAEWLYKVDYTCKSGSFENNNKICNGENAAAPLNGGQVDNRIARNKPPYGKKGPRNINS
jgi:hypothetical protein